MTGPTIHVHGGSPVINLGGGDAAGGSDDAGTTKTAAADKGGKGGAKAPVATDTGSGGGGKGGIGGKAGAATPPAPKGEPVKGVPALRRYVAVADAPGKAIGAKAAALVPKGMPMVGTAARVGGRFLPLVGSLLAMKHSADEFRSGDPIGGCLAAVGVIPGPVGWLGLGLDVLWDNWGPDHGSGTSYELWAAPDGVRTQMLPGVAADEPNVAAFDAVLADAQLGVFGYEMGPHGTVWGSTPPAAMRVDTAPVKTALDAWLHDLALTFSEIDRTLGATGEPYMITARQHLSSALAAMRDLPAAAKAIETELTAASGAAGKLYATVIDANTAARTALAGGNGLGGNDFSGGMQKQLQVNQQNLENANQKLAAVLDGKALAPLAPTQRLMPETRTNTGTGPAAMPAMPQLQPGLPMPAPAPPLTPAAVTPAPEKDKNDVADLLSKLGNNIRSGAPQMPALPQMPLMPGLGGGMPLGGQPLGGQPLQAPAPKPLAPEAKPVLGAERKSLSGTPAENSKAVPAAEKRIDTAGEKKAEVPGAGAAAAAAPGKPQLETPLTKAASAKPAGDDHTVDVKGKQIQFPDAKTAALAKELVAGTAGNPASLADAATKAGLVPPVPGQDPGQQVAPADAKPGDLLVAGDKSYLNLGDGQFLDHTTGKVIDAEQMPKDLGPKGGYFHLADTAAGAQPGPVSGPAPATTTVTVDQVPQVPAAAPAPAGVTSAGSPGVPAAVPGAGPANAAATDTGRGTAVLVPGGRALDPAAIK